MSELSLRLRFRYCLQACILLSIIACAEPSVMAAPPKPILISRPASTRALALEATTLVTEPFASTAPATSILYGSDKRTRLLFYAVNLAVQPGDLPASISAGAEDASHRQYLMIVEDIRPLAGQEWISQITLRVDEEIGDVGGVLVGINYQGVGSNRVRVGFGHTGGGLPDDAGAVPTPAQLYKVSGRATLDGIGASGVLMSLNGVQTATALTDSNGNYSFLATVGGTYTVIPSSQLYNFAPQQVILDSTAGDQTSVGFSAARKPYTISGQVKADQGAGMEGVNVTLTSSAPNSSPKTIVTSSGGAFSFPDLPAAYNYTIAVASTNVFDFAPQTISVLDKNSSVSFTGTRRHYAISGQINAEGNQLDGVTVNLTGGNNLNPLTTVTSGGGRFSFNNVTAGFSYTIAPSPTSFYAFAPQVLGSLTSDQTTAAFEGTLRSYTISGLITDENNSPLSNIAIQVSSTNGYVSNLVLTDTSGRYKSESLTASYSYIVAPYDTLTHSFTTRTTGSLGADQSVNFSGVRRHYRISGTIKDRSQQNVAGVSVTLSGPFQRFAMTDANGFYVFTDLPAGNNYQIGVEKTGYMFDPPVQFDGFLAGDVQTDFTAIRIYKIAGRVIDNNGRGLIGVTMNLSGPESGKTVTDSNGSYLFITTTSGFYDLMPSKEQDFYTFSPSSQSFSNANATSLPDFTATFSPVTSPTSVLEFDGTPKTVDYGSFWPEGVDLGHFFWEVWAMPGNNAYSSYMISDGYGGAHALLFGFFSSGTPNHYSLYGNIYTGVGSIAFNSEEGPVPGEWAHLAVGWDGHNITTYYDGVPVGRTAFAGPRRTIGPASGGGRLFIGGSDHNNVPGRIAQVRGYEGSNPREGAPESAFAPETVFSLGGNFLTYYFRPSRNVADLSHGYNGSAHAGLLCGVTRGIFYGCADSPLPQFVSDSTAPDFSNPTNPGHIVSPVDAPPASAPAGARVYDSFSRSNSPSILGSVGGLGSTEGGTAGQKLWQTDRAVSEPQPFGILNERAVLLGNDRSVAWVSTGSSTGNLDVRVNRHPGSGGSGMNTGLSFRVLDSNNYFFAYTSDTDGDLSKPKTLTVGYYQSGVRTNLAAEVPMPDSWNIMLRVVTTSTGSISVYADDELVYSSNSSIMATATGAGLYNNSAGMGLVNRWDNFAVFDVP